jgi:Spy/CpxP family protein refolding chaperone
MVASIRVALAASIAVIAALQFAPATAQPSGGGAFMGPGMMGPGMMGGMMGRHGFGAMCNPGMAGFAEWRSDRLVDQIKLTDAQRAKFDEFKAAAVKSGETMRSACLADVPNTIVGRAEAMEKRMDTMLQAIKTMRPALEAFYATLTDEQKSKLDSTRGLGRGHGFWRWRDSW